MKCSDIARNEVTHSITALFNCAANGGASGDWKPYLDGSVLGSGLSQVLSPFCKHQIGKETWTFSYLTSSLVLTKPIKRSLDYGLHGYGGCDDRGLDEVKLQAFANCYVVNPVNHTSCPEILTLVCAVAK